MRRIYSLNDDRFESESSKLSNCHWRKPDANGFRSSKQIYLTKQEAKRALKEIGKGSKLNAYKCPVCGYWHLGHKKG